MSAARPTILLVEDEADDAELVMRALEKAGFQHRIIHLTGGDEAMRYLAGDGEYSDRTQYRVPDLILLDLKMPRVNGFEVLSWLRERPELAQIPVVVLSGSVIEHDRVKAKALGAADYEAKPVSLHSLIGIVDRVARKFVREQ